ncbi:hypothetical protein [Candidatus Chloroploca asiatica]|uniref:Uncharacterized protein n=1 Tax=Candidatus Chloroploca asiatica TaxID=1506545 RepID=A0A2H3KZW3_9CHLR|nr:hypothetical protein [Candidatus Chloroploca asiatica]PDV97915.1 hypothetical protein A9Q02_16965 [Candidatus Chloroploca asiatica]
MQNLVTSLRCSNCGTPLELPAKGVFGVNCPVCQLLNTFGVLLPDSDLTAETFEAQLGNLVAQARTSGIPLDVIVHTLRDELEFSAELASRGRDLYVQIIDLGPSISQPLRRSQRDDSAMLRGRSVGG